MFMTNEPTMPKKHLFDQTSKLDIDGHNELESYLYYFFASRYVFLHTNYVSFVINT